MVSCDRPYYRQRRELNYKTYMEFQRIGFVVVFLFAGLTDDAKLSENSDGTFILRVPTLDMYELLSHKMELAYKYFSEVGCSGILKIDDDIKIINAAHLEKACSYYLDKCDYFGISIGSSGNIPKNSPLFIKKHSLNLFKNLRLIDTNIIYAGGPFYWVSSKTIEHIVKDGLEFVYEDLSVGNLVKNHPELKVAFDDSLYRKVVNWDKLGMNNQTYRIAFLLTLNKDSERAKFSKLVLEKIGFEVQFMGCIENKDKVLSNKLSMQNIYNLIKDLNEPYYYIFEDDINSLEEIKLDEIIQYENISPMFFYLGICERAYETSVLTQEKINGHNIFYKSGNIHGLHAIGISTKGASELLEFSKYSTERYMDVILSDFSLIHPANIVRYDLESYIPGHRGIIFQDRNKFPSSIG